MQNENKVFNNTKREWLLIGVLIGVVLSVAAYFIGSALA